MSEPTDAKPDTPSPAPAAARPQAKRRWWFALLAVGLGLLLLEGLASAGMFVYDVLFKSEGAIAERTHTQYDEQIGWVSVPNGKFVDLYGAGGTLTTNAQGFRGAEEITPQVPSGKVRVLCSGDSYTLGYGVGDEATWPHELSQIVPQFQTVNLGQGGYGIDQSFLWFRRASEGLSYDVHVFAFIDDDFARMQVDNFSGYGKPLIRWRENPQQQVELVVENVPVPRSGYWSPWLTQNSKLLRQVRLITLWDRVWEGMRGPVEQRATMDVNSAISAALVIFQSAAQIDQQRQAVTLFAYLPREVDYGKEMWLRPILREEMARRGLLYVDVAEALSKVPAEQVKTLFLRPDEVDFPGAAGHYTAAGNRFVAEVLAAKLREIPLVVERLKAAGAVSGS
jgi:hypothetical protein